MVAIPNVQAIIVCDSCVDAVDAGAGPGLLRIYTGAAPGVDDAPTGTLLAEITLQDPAFGAAADVNPGAQAALLGVPLTDSAANATGTAGWARIVDSNGVTRLQPTLSVTGGGGELQLVTLNIVADQPVQVTSLTITMPES